MSHVSVRPLSTDESELLESLFALAISGTNQGIAKISATEFENRTFGSGSGSVDSVNGLTGAITLSAGSNITITPSGNTLTIASTGAGYTNLTQFVDQTAWRVFYSDGSGDVTELALGADGTFLKSNGAAAAPTFATPAGSGDVTKVGTPVDTQVTYWTGDGTAAGDAGFVYNATTNVGTIGGLNVSGLTASEIVITDGSKNLVSAAVATYPSLTELTYVKGVTSAIQTQINAKAPSTSPTFATSITGSYLTASEILITDGSKNIVSAAVATYPSLTELTYVKGVTSAIQTQIDSKAAHATTITIAGTANQITSSAGAQDLSANRTWTLSFPADVIIPTVLTVPNTGLHLLDTNASHDLIIKPGSNLTADKTLTLTTGDADVILDLTAVTDEYVLAYDVGTNTWRGVVNSGGGATTALDNLASVAINAALVLGTSDAFALGSATKMWSDLFLASGAVINFDNGNAAITHSAGILTVSTGDLRVTTAGTNSASAVTVGGTQTLTSKSMTSPVLTSPRIASGSFIGDVNGDNVFTFTTGGAGRINWFEVDNAATGGNPKLTAIGTDANIGIDFTAKGAASINIRGNSTQSGELRIYEDTDAGTNYSAFKVPAMASSVTYTLPDAVGGAGTFLKDVAGDGVLSWATPAGSGDVTAALNLTDNAIVRGDGGAKGVQTSSVLIDDSNNISGVVALTITGQLQGSNAGNSGRFRNTTDGASVQVLKLEGDRATYADNDEAYLSMLMSDDLDAQTEVARMTWVATDVSSGTMDSRIDFAVITGGSLADELSLDGTNLFPSTSDGLALGNASNMWADLFLASGSVIDWNGDVTLTHSANTLTLAGGTLALGAENLTMTGSLAATGARVTKGWFTDIESTNMPTVGGTAILTSLTAPTFNTIELGTGQTDTTLSRSAAGVLAVEGVAIPTISSTNTLTNKRITKRVTTETSSATPTINTDNSDMHRITALAAAITSMTSNLSGTPTDGQTLWIAITDDGTARAITWGTSFEASGNTALPTTTVISTRLDVGFVWNTATSKWRCIAVS